MIKTATIVCVALTALAGSALAQTSTQPAPSAGQSDDKWSTGRQQKPETKGQMQPQGWTGPINTESGGPPAASPQGQSPPGMQSAPEGSSKTTVSPDKSKP